MEKWIEIANRIYENMEDELSRRVFLDRLSYSVSQDKIHIEKLLDDTVRYRKEWSLFINYVNGLNMDEFVLFGNGIWGATVLSELKDIKIKCIIDNAPSATDRNGISVIGASVFLNSYRGEKIIISSHKNRQSMIEQCRNAGVPDINILDAASVIYGLTEGKIYFDEDILLKIGNGVFIDGGSFDGCDSKRFIEKYHGKTICFEPDKSNIGRIEDKLKSYEGAYRVIPKALWVDQEELSFSSSGSQGSKIDVSGTENTVSATSIDIEVGSEPVAMIKMDIEGAELKALYGAVNTIKRDHPILAISVYHKPEDILSIPEFIMNTYEEYRFYLRHYSFSWYDTVLYAVPKEMI